MRGAVLGMPLTGSSRGGELPGTPALARGCVSLKGAVPGACSTEDRAQCLGLAEGRLPEDTPF